MVQELEYELFRVLKLNFKSEFVLDYGCGVGFVVKAMQNLGYIAMGYDHSSWAIEWGRENLFGQRYDFLEYPSSLQDDMTRVHHHGKKQWELMTSFDVFEHMTLDDVTSVLKQENPHHLLVRIPLTKEDGGKFILPVSEADPTHITRLTRESWVKYFNDNGYRFLFNINLGNIYDSDGVMCAMFRNT
jgi:predicted TPR repeat methyltransferase